MNGINSLKSLTYKGREKQFSLHKPYIILKLTQIYTVKRFYTKPFTKMKYKYKNIF